ncbi:MAG: hypothetical protein EOO12_00225 [Chitinophagaceae bacterium]|nr:MAG: hypothetical protein EOO12_00225 [Chitinophagaceae bacterium]
MPFSTYAEVSAALSSWEERTFTSTETDEFIALAEAAANRRLRQDFRRRTSTTITTDASGEATLPSGFVGMTSLVRDVVGSVPLVQVSWDAAIWRNPYEVAVDANAYAINGTALKVAPVTEDTFICMFSSVLTGLSASNTTNWLLTLAPDFYLFYGQAMAAAKYKDYGTAEGLSANALAILDELVSQGNVAEYGNAEMSIAMVTP